jgi:hypothetical protein
MDGESMILFCSFVFALDIFLCNTCCRYAMLNGIIESRKVRAQKGVSSSHSSESTFLPRRSEDRFEIEMLKESLKEWDEEMRWRDEVMRQQDDFYAQAFTQQQTILQVSRLNNFIRYRALSNTFKANLLHYIMYGKWRISK